MRKKRKSPQETQNDSMTTHHHLKRAEFGILWRPNNYRRQIKIKKRTDSATQKIGSTIRHHAPKAKCTIGKIISIKKYKENITLQIGKNTLTCIWAQKKRGKQKQTYYIEADTQEGLDKAISAKKEKIKERMDKCLYEFGKLYGLLYAVEKPTWQRHEDWAKGEEVIDSIPKDMIIHDTHFKKVYGEGVEFKGGKGEEPTAKLKNYLKNRAIENVAPEIEEKLDNMLYIQERGAKLMDTFLHEVIPIQREFAKNIRSHTTVVREMAKAVKKFNTRLSQRKITDFI